jgi:hypothetical protein
MIELENRSNSMIERIYCLCRVRGGHGSGVEGSVIREFQLPFVDWDDRIIESKPDLIAGGTIRLPLVGVTFDLEKSQATFWLLTGERSATHVSSPSNSMIFEYTIVRNQANERIKLIPLVVADKVIRFSMEINSLNEEFEMKF